MSEIIDWTLPIETDEPMPRPARVVHGPKGAFHVSVFGDVFSYNLNGMPKGIGPKIRNVRPLRTSDECLQRMEALVRRMADGWQMMGLAGPEVNEAREIVKLLPVAAVDPNLIEARKLVADAYHQDGSTSYEAVMDGMRDNDEAVGMALSGVKRGRELVISERYEADSTPGSTRDLILMLIEREAPGAEYAYRCDPNVRSVAESIARKLGMQP